MLGGFGQLSSIDAASSRKFIQPFIKVNNKLCAIHLYIEPIQSTLNDLKVPIYSIYMSCLEDKTESFSVFNIMFTL